MLCCAFQNKQLAFSGCSGRPGSGFSTKDRSTAGISASAWKIGGEQKEVEFFKASGDLTHKGLLFCDRLKSGFASGPVTYPLQSPVRGLS